MRRLERLLIRMVREQKMLVEEALIMWFRIQLISHSITANTQGVKLLP